MAASRRSRSLGDRTLNTSLSLFFRGTLAERQRVGGLRDTQAKIDPD